MEQASRATRAQVEYLSVPPGGSSSGARPLLTSLALRHCGLIVVSGRGPSAAVGAVARQFRTVRFVVVGSVPAGPNIVMVNGTAAAVRSAIARLVTAATVAGA
jgi:hypothetical protein